MTKKKDQYTGKDARRDTDASRREQRAAWHDARTDDQTSDDPSADYGDREATYSDDRGALSTPDKE